ncbi:hypothetical protein QBC47DRAFT_177751 [Echria macrotheca]|uniref:Secreted protein n=1 Tax=Echria macrotheca TaxID=438768 RepID=A0AAJ0FD58_9PEZI|nr:hypothetical protein QBC47DRAFT_177751 [Echria macrotheca]
MFLAPRISYLLSLLGTTRVSTDKMPAQFSSPVATRCSHGPRQPSTGDEACGYTPPLSFLLRPIFLRGHEPPGQLSSSRFVVTSSQQLDGTCP